jgi:hypothetical protein
MKIIAIKKVPTEKVYDITVKDAHHYILENGAITHNSGLEYAASTILFLSKKKDKDKSDNSVTGAIITANLKKARLTIENKKVETLLDYATGLDPYYGLLDLAEKFGIFKKVSNKFELPDGTKAFESAIEKNPEKFFTKAILDLIDEKCKDEFLYGKSSVTTVEENE